MNICSIWSGGNRSLDTEDRVADKLLGDELDSAREAIAEQELPESWFENACEEP